MNDFDLPTRIAWAAHFALVTGALVTAAILTLTNGGAQ